MKLTIEHFYTEALKRILMNVREISIYNILAAWFIDSVSSG